MISTHQIQTFLNKPCDDHTWIKGLSEQQLDEQIAKLNPKPELHPDLKIHQKACFLLGVAYPQFYNMLDLGAGKTLIMLSLIKYYLKIGRIKQWALVLVPTDELVWSWEDEIHKWHPELPYLTLTGTTEQKWASLEGFKTGLVICTYVGVATMLSRLQKIRGKDKRKHHPDAELLKQFIPQLDALICDQSTFLGNATTLTYEIVGSISKHAKIRFNLAGRPFSRDPIILWSQFYVIDRGETLTPQFGFFREVFFDKKKAWFGGPNSYEYKFRKKLEPQLARLISHRSIYYSREECSDLPERTFIRCRVSFPTDMQAYYKRVVKEVLQSRNSYKEMENAFVKMRQICSGFIGFKNEDEERVQLDFKMNPKLDALFEKLEEMPEDSKSIIFYEFTHSGKKICDELRKRKMRHGWLWSGTVNGRAILESFNNDPGFRFLVNQYRRGGMGLNLQAADYVFFFESPASYLYRYESEGRNYRQGQTKHVFVYDIVVKDSIEETILDYHKEGKTLFKALVEDPKKILKAA
jgi:SNF2 family DNA or RNA helicase